MTPREIITAFFECNEHGTARQILASCNNAVKENVLNNWLSRMSTEGKISRRTNGKDRSIIYHKAEPKDDRPHKVIKNFLLGNPRSTVEQIAAGSGVSVARVRIYINSRHNAGALDCEVGEKTQKRWSLKKEMPFGCGNEFIMALNKALADVRKSRG